MRILRRQYLSLACLLFAGTLFAQDVLVSVTDSSNHSATFHPEALRTRPRIPDAAGALPLVTVPRPRTVTAEEYIRLKTSPGRTPSTVPPPQIPGLGPRIPAVVATPSLASVPTVSYEGMPATQFIPPSSNVAAGPEDVIQIMNSHVARFDKAGNRTDYVSLPDWFSQFQNLYCASGTFFCLVADPQIRYDQLHGRFILSAQALDTVFRSSYFLISVSNGATFASGWKNWALDARLHGGFPADLWADFPQIGFDDKAVYLTALMFTFDSFEYQYSKLRIFRKQDLYNPDLTTLQWKEINDFRNFDGTRATTLQPAQVRGRPGVGAPGGLIINTNDNEYDDYVTLWQINDPTGAVPTATRSTVHGLWPYTWPAPAPQLGASVPLDTGPPSVLKAVYREGILYFAFNSRYPDQGTTVTLNRLDVANEEVTLQTRLMNGNYFYPSFDVPASIGKANEFPNVIAVGTTTDATGALTYPGIQGTKPGEDFFDILTGGGTSARWGDYFGAAVDPISGGLWVSGEYGKQRTGNVALYSTWNAFFPWNTAQFFEDVAPQSDYFHYINVLRLWDITQGCSATPALFCPSELTNREQMAAFIVRSLYGENFTYPQTPYFTDVPATSNFFPYIQKLRELGITIGCTATEYCPLNLTTRGQMATFIIRAKMKSLFGESFTYPQTPYFSDVPASSDLFKYVQKMRELGYTSGYPTPDTFGPDVPIKREQTATFLVRAFLN